MSLTDRLKEIRARLDAATSISASEYVGDIAFNKSSYALYINSPADISLLLSVLEIYKTAIDTMTTNNCYALDEMFRKHYVGASGRIKMAQEAAIAGIAKAEQLVERGEK